MTILGQWPLMIVTAGLCVSAGACSFLTRMEGISASGRPLSGCLDGSWITFKAKDGLECRGSYKHGFSGGEGSVRCSDGRTGTFSMASTQSLLGPGHSKGRGEGMIGDERFAFTY
ncbi:hypothetical protein [Methylobacterium nonmethylotrophicum]|uniref:Uncharacterized protein n=1 Tax=Methylobacterium nonmethylotrophicum TaxID=1141884 RepID=A0A4Z0NN44_9HYPH|nr:hypothetical protein [Methylobacterium nonmethylotrophicum]TGD98047.1 hypothetical protein EU555_18035 [Methylobacterium nonmethylotrophicum]